MKRIEINEPMQFSGKIPGKILEKDILIWTAEIWIVRIHSIVVTHTCHCYWLMGYESTLYLELTLQRNLLGIMCRIQTMRFD